MASPWRWEPALRRYRNTRTGRFLSNDGMRGLRDAFISSLYDDANQVAGRLARREITLNGWLAEARKISAAANIDLYILARGGRKRMTPQDWGWLGSQIKRQYREYLQPFAQAIADETLTEAQAARRLRMYVDAGRQASMQGARQAAKGAGLTQERNVLSAAEHCRGCVAETRRDWVAIGRLVPLTQRDCLTNDRCDIEYR